MFSTAIFLMLQKVNLFVPHLTMVTLPINSFITPRTQVTQAVTDDPWFHDPNLNSQQATPSLLILSTDPPDLNLGMNSTLSRATNLPMMDINISDLPCSKGTWEQAIAQWFESDPKTGIALKDWPEEWYKGPMQSKTGSKRSHRALIAEEYTWYVLIFEHQVKIDDLYHLHTYRLGSTREGFLCVYPDADTISLTALLNTIQGRQGHQRISKNGMPAQQGTGTRLSKVWSWTWWTQVWMGPDPKCLGPGPDMGGAGPEL